MAAAPGEKSEAPPLPKRASLGGAKQQRVEAFRWGPAWPRGSDPGLEAEAFLLGRLAVLRFSTFRVQALRAFTGRGETEFGVASEYVEQPGG